MITPITVRDVLETFHLRTVLEVEATGLAVDRISEQDIRALEQNHQQELLAAQDGIAASSYQKGYELNREFHLIIARASDNSRLVRLVEQFIDEMERILALDPHITGPQQHTELLDALKRRDRAAAQEAMRRHLEETKARILGRF
jgi:DNA-binding GntR family transcriptional regulator